MGRRQIACRTCAAIKTICSKEAPCARCRRLSLTCSLVATAPIITGPGHCVKTANGSGSAYPSQGFRVRHIKSSTGCASCRRRRKKCDERRPKCGDCSRLGLSCVLPDTVESLGSRTRTTLPPNAPASLQDEFAEVHLEKNASPPGQRVSVATFDWLSVVDEEYSTERLPHRQSLANSSALEVRPEHRADSGGVPMPVASTALWKSAGITPELLQDWEVGEKHLLNHFLQSVARSLVLVEDDENPFICITVPMALENTTIRHALAALSACHLSRIYPEFERDLFHHRSYALRGLKAELESQKNRAASLTATLFLCLLEICAGNSRRWLLYLHGARAILNSKVEASESPTMDFLTDLYDYLCVIASLTADNVPSPCHQSKFGLMSPGPSGIHPIFGIASNLYTTLARVNHLSHLHSNDHILSSDRSSEAQDQLKSEVEAVEMALQSWSPLVLGEDLRQDMVEVRAAAFAVQWATMLRLRDIVDVDYSASKLDAAQNRAQGHVDNILSVLSLIRPGSRMEAHMLFPLFMAGIFSTTKAGRLTLEFRINQMSNSIGFGSIASAHQMLGELWARVNRGEPCHWKALMRSKAPGIVLF
ncbi:fungal-specific transcription factor domain-containing protein [Xylariales sp. PMI_506]|nr:fungal-specific transcription factor domain-containing protein [Xylariales sp. PMI_506]